jgi:bifunctional non-homologous end joining protein LigD
VDVALLLKQKLDELTIRSYVKTSGKKGLHILIPVVPEHTFSQTREFVHQIGKHLAREYSVAVSEHSKTKEPGKVYIDYLQNSHGRTAVCPYSLRATPQATVSMPINWKDVKKGIKPEAFTLFTAVKSESNPWKGMLTDKQNLKKGMS